MGKIKKVTLWVIICLCLYFSACSKKQESMENSNDLGMNENNSDEHNGSEEITGISKVIDDGTGAGANLEDALILKDGLKDETLVSGTITDEDELEKLASLDVNIKGETNQVLLCKDPINNIVYYVNYGVDYFIYRIKDGKSELVVELPAKRLFFQEGKLYFMLESYGIYTLKDMRNGNIFSYDPVSGEVTKIIDDTVTMMIAYDDGIYYYSDIRESGGNTADRRVYYYSFATLKSEIIHENILSIYKWNEYYLTYELKPSEDDDTLFNIVGLKLETLDKKKLLNLTVEELPQYYSLVGSKFYYIIKSEYIGIYDIDTNVREEIYIVDALSDFSGFKDFTLLDGIVYLNNKIMIDLETGMQSLVSPKDVAETIYEMYTDGENLYGICGQNGNRVMKQIIIEEQNDQTIIENPGTSNEYEMYRYVYYTKPLE